MVSATIPQFSATHLSDGSRTGARDDQSADASKLRVLLASWHDLPGVIDRRGGHRCACRLPAVVLQVEADGQTPVAGADLCHVTLKDLSRHGLAFTHKEPMAARQVLVSFDPVVSAPVRAVVRLKWCRFKRPGVCESGGQIVRVLASCLPAQSSASEPGDACA